MKVDWNKVLKISLITAPLLVGAYFIYKQLQQKPVYNKPIARPDPPKIDVAKPADVAIEKSSFPLKKGVKNEYVGKLQDELGTPITNYFGDLTAAALLSQCNKTQIDNYADLMATLTMIYNQDNASDVVDAKTAASDALLKNFKNQYFASIVAKNDTVLKLATTNTSTYFYWTGSGATVINWQQGMSYMVAQYTPVGVMEDGSLVLKTSSDGNDVYYGVNPFDITYQQSSSSSSSTDNTSGSTASVDESNTGNVWSNAFNNWSW